MRERHAVPDGVVARPQIPRFKCRRGDALCVPEGRDRLARLGDRALPHVGELARVEEVVAAEVEGAVALAAGGGSVGGARL
jgi:hypothetical protein